MDPENTLEYFYETNHITAAVPDTNAVNTNGEHTHIGVVEIVPKLEIYAKDGLYVADKCGRLQNTSCTGHGTVRLQMYVATCV